MKKYNSYDMMKKPKIKQVKSKQIEEWIQAGRAVLRNDLRPEYMEDWSDYYLLDNVGLLIRDTFERKNATLYEKYSEYLTFISKEEKRTNQAKQQTVSSDASFPAYIQVTVNEFKEIINDCDSTIASELSIPLEVLDYSMESLNQLDKSIKKALKTFDTGDFSEKYSVLISAYCGEVMKRKIDGAWKITGNENGMLNQILILEKDNPEHSYRPEIPIALIFSGDAPRGSTLRIEVDAQLHKYGFID